RICFARGRSETARKSRTTDLGRAIKPLENGEGRTMPAPEIEPMAGPAPIQIASSFPPIAEYAFLSDCEANCLLAPSGRVEWRCVPRPDSPSVFASVLDRGAGNFRFGPTGVSGPPAR